MVPISELGEGDPTEIEDLLSGGIRVAEFAAKAEDEGKSPRKKGKGKRSKKSPVKSPGGGDED